MSDNEPSDTITFDLNANEVRIRDPLVIELLVAAIDGSVRPVGACAPRRAAARPRGHRGEHGRGAPMRQYLAPIKSVFRPHKRPGTVVAGRDRDDDAVTATGHGPVL